MAYKEDWREVPGPEGLIIEMDIESGEVRQRYHEGDDGSAGVREPSRPKLPPFADGTALSTETYGQTAAPEE